MGSVVFAMFIIDGGCCFVEGFLKKGWVMSASDEAGVEEIDDCGEVVRVGVLAIVFGGKSEDKASNSAWGVGGVWWNVEV